jgi:ribosomal protein S2
LTSQKTAKYLLGTRETLEVFKMYELRYLLLKIYPLIHNIFHNSRGNPKVKFKNLWMPNLPSQQKLLSSQKIDTFNLQNSWPFKQRSFFVFQRKQIMPQILFASVTPNLSEIIYTAAQLCNMPSHKNRWLNGSITAAISYASDKQLWQYLQDLTQEKTSATILAKWGQNKENNEKSNEKFNYYSKSRWPSLLIIPDISKNNMILKEAGKVGLPVMGLVNSNCPVEIDYPIFAQDETLQNIHFFCHFLATSIAKETIFCQHKYYTLQKSLDKKSQKKMAKKMEQNITFQKIKNLWKKNFAFKTVKPWQKRMLKRYFLSRKVYKYHPGLARKYRSIKLRKRRRKKIFFRYKMAKNWIPIKQRKQKILFFLKNKLRFKLSKKHRLSFIKNKLRFKLSKRHRLSLTVIKKIFQRRRRGTFFVKKKNPFIIVNKKIFQKENFIKYSKNYVEFPDEKRKIRQKFRNFLWSSKLLQRWIINRRLFPKPYHFSKTTNYFWWSLKQWFQNIKWQNKAALIKPLLHLKLVSKEDIKDYKYRFHKKALKRRRRPKPKGWQVWMKKNRYPQKKRVKFELKLNDITDKKKKTIKKTTFTPKTF